MIRFNIISNKIFFDQFPSSSITTEGAPNNDLDLESLSLKSNFLFFGNLRTFCASFSKEKGQPLELHLFSFGCCYFLFVCLLRCVYCQAAPNSLYTTSCLYKLDMKCDVQSPLEKQQLISKIKRVAFF